MIRNNHKKNNLRKFKGRIKEDHQESMLLRKGRFRLMRNRIRLRNKNRTKMKKRDHQDGLVQKDQRDNQRTIVFRKNCLKIRGRSELCIFT